MQARADLLTYWAQLGESTASLFSQKGCSLVAILLLLLLLLLCAVNFNVGFCTLQEAWWDGLCGPLC